MSRSFASSPPQAIGVAAVLLLCGNIWALSHVFQGIFHDANLYTLQALGWLSPDSLSHDVFLHLGSQDRYTIFSPIFAFAIQILGPEWAAASLTLASQIAFFVGGWVLARSVVPPWPALLGVSVLMAIPGEYGAYRIFTCVEPFLTPRMAAEALALASVAAALRARTRPAIVLIVLAAVVHPIMAAAGAVALLLIYLIFPRPRLGGLLLGAAILAMTGMFVAAPDGIWGKFDPTWLQLVKDRSPYLFLSSWQLEDWGRVAVTLATLAIGIRTLSGTAGRTLSKIALLTTAGGLLLTFIACDAMHLVLITQLQPWRWEWLGTATAALLLPSILHSCWSLDTSHRATALLLAAACIFGANDFALDCAVAAVGVRLLTRRLASSELRWVLWGAIGMLAIAVIWRVATNLEFTDSHYLELATPLWLRRTMSFVHDGSAPIAVIALTWWLSTRPRGHFGVLAVALLAAGACLALVPQTWAVWTHRQFPPQRVAEFAAWREIIPAGADVFAPDSPLAAWILLDRPSYVSALQSSGMVFSRPAALELQRRAAAIGSVVSPQTFLSWKNAGTGLVLSVQQLQHACRLAVFPFLVTGADIGMTPIGVVSGRSGRLFDAQRLYRCANQSN